ncbi:nSTAND1 domain-containing NTPase [Insolitispirillum peregrinum]|uniref:nSTAND1 domain-containing NTPase n=1 Tax=Insolitispirillum peregrinum TaxID=80876 RepID=UPI000970D8AA|nr:trypsin-like peptidase domain-containing protein [Insolitispirillum peregrinum]
MRIWPGDAAGNRRDGPPVGTGFLVSGADGQTYALTCAHVVSAALGPPFNQSPPSECLISANLPGHGTLTLRLRAWVPPLEVYGSQEHDGVADIAILSPVDQQAWPTFLPLRIEPPRQVVPLNASLPFYSFGFMGSAHGLPTNGRLTATDARNWFVADGATADQPFIEEGLSGAPAIAADHGSILGMVVERRVREERQGFVIPAYALAKAWPPLASPYPGLAAFDGNTAHLFFGRGRAQTALSAPTGKLKEALEQLERQRLMAVVGTSGSGKSSFVKAGLAEEYRRHGWTVFLFRPSDVRYQAVSEQLAAALARPLGADPSFVPRRTLIIIDQFEEFFPDSARDDDHRSAQDNSLIAQRTVILRRILDAVERDEAHCLLTARLDLLETMITADETVARLFSAPYPMFTLSAMNRAEVREAITGPAALFGVEAEAGFTEVMAIEATREPGRLPLLQEALRHCWRHLAQTRNHWLMRQPSTTTADDPAQILEEALAHHGDHAVDNLHRQRFQNDDIDRVLLSLVRLVDGRALRRRLVLAEASATDRQLLTALSSERITVLSEDSKQPTVELVHEALMARWHRLSTLIDDHRRFLAWRDRFEREHAVWEAGERAERDLLRRHDLDQAGEWLVNATGLYAPPPPPQSDYIAASQAFHLQEDQRKEQQLRDSEQQNQRLQQQNRRTRRWLRISAGLLLISLIALLAIGGLYQMVRAQTDAAQRQESRALAALAQQENERGDHMTAILLALEALPDPAKHRDRPVTAEAEAALRQAWLRNREERTLVGHEDRVTAASFSPDGKKVLTASYDGTARVWDLSSSPPTAISLNGHKSAVGAASFSPDGRRVVTASDDNTARVWDLSAQTPTAIVLKGHTGDVTAASFSPDGRRVLTASYDQTARVWDLSDLTLASLVLKGHTGHVTAASFSPDGQRVITASDDKTARVWNLSDLMLPSIILSGHTDRVTAVNFSPDGLRVLTASDDQTARVWNLSGPIPTAIILKGHTGGINAARFNSNGFRVVTASRDTTARVWDLSSPTPTTIVLNGHERAITDANFSPDERKVITASDDKTARVWNLSNPIPTAIILSGHELPVSTANFSPDGRKVVTASSDNTARVWNLSDSPLTTDNFSHGGQLLISKYGENTFKEGNLATRRLAARLLHLYVGSTSFSPDGRKLVTTSWDNTARIWDLSGPLPTAIDIKGHELPINDANFSPDGQWVVTASSDETARMWDLSGPTPTMIVLRGHTERVSTADFSPDGRRVVTASIDKTARVWDLSGSTPTVIVLKGHTGGVTAASFSPDGQRVVTASDDKTARVWDMSGSTPTAIILEGHESIVTAASFSTDGRRVITASSDKTARVWDLSGSTPTAIVLSGHEGGVTAASFSTDGRRVITASSDKTARVWDLSGPTPTSIVLSGHMQSVTVASFSPDERKVVTASPDNTARVWDLSGPTPVASILGGQASKIFDAQFRPDGHQIVTASTDDTIRLWDYPDVSTLIVTARAHVSHCLSAEQRQRFGLSPTLSDRDSRAAPLPDLQGYCPS